MNPNSIRALSNLGICVLIGLCAAMPAQAQSRKERAAIEALEADMSRAEAAHAASMQAGEDGTKTDAALSKMESIVAACAKLRGCGVEPMLQRYRRALETVQNKDDAGDEDENPIDFTAEDVPDAANADVLLGERNRRFTESVQFNPAVQAGIRRWLTDMRPSLIASYENFQYLKPLMAPAFQRAGLPEALLFGILAKESNGKVHVGSRAGAVGPMQFMPATGRRYGLGDDGSGFDTRYDARAAAQAAASYLLERYAELNNNIELSLAAYNGGEGRAARVFRETGGRSFWDYDVYNQFPAETKDYVPMVIAAAWLYLHPDDYGLRFPRVASRPAQMTLQKPSSINELTICLGNSRNNDGYMRALRNLNPRYEPGRYLPAGTVLNVTTNIARLYDFYCTRGKRAEIAQQLVASDPSSAIVRVGPIAPTGDAASTVVATDAPAPAPPVQAPAKPAPVVAKSKPKPAREHRVRHGDTLSSIARKYDCDVRELSKANGLKAPGFKVHAGQSIKLAGCTGP